MDAEGTDVTSEAGNGLRRSVRERRLRRLARISPWVSLAISIASAVWMKRDENAAALVAGAVAAGTLATSVLLWSRRARLHVEGAGLRGRFVNLASAVATQSMAQLPVFFSLPFYLVAFAWTPLQWGFLGLFAAVVVIVVWDPLAFYVLPHRRFGAPLQGFCAFVGLRAALPMLGVPAHWALLLALSAIFVLTYWDLILRWPEAGWLRKAAFSLGLVAALLLLTPTMPAAPLRLVHVGLGTGVVERELQGASERFAAGSRLHCFTAIFSPQDTEASVLHRWTRDGMHVADVELSVRGGRERGFRTWSRLHAGRAGQYRCEVRTRLGQVLGATDAVVR